MLPDATDASAELDADATRRSFIKKVAIGGAVAAIGSQVLPLNALVPGAAGQEEEDGGDGAGGDDPTTETTQPGTEAESGGTPLSADQAVMAFLAGLALAGAALYRAAAGDEATGGDDEEEDGAADPAAPTTTTTTLPAIEVPLLAEPVVEVLRVFGSHHAQQATALNSTLPVAVEVPNGTFQDEIRTALGTATDAAAVLATLRQMEERLASTHLAAVERLTDTTDASLVSAALPIVSQHAVVLGLISPTATPLEELVPELQTTDDALRSTEYPTEVAPGGTPGDTDPDANAGGEGTDGGSTGESPGDGTDSSGGGADGGSGTDGGTSSDPESGNP